MISEKMKPYVKNNSAIRMMFEEGNRLRAKYGADKVFDFTCPMYTRQKTIY